MPRNERVQVLLSEEERERFRMHAKATGTSLSNWLRRAGLKQADELESRPRLDSVDALEEFFAECDALDDSGKTEPDWEQTKKLIADSRARGLPGE
jgi:hypothetical protein